MNDADMTICDLRQQITQFVQERDWEQFHNPKDLAMAIGIEAAELQELYLWKTAAEVDEVAQHPDTRRQVVEELADVMILCFSLANRLDIDAATAVQAKLAANAAKYPVHLARGRAHKYTSYVRAACE